MKTATKEMMNSRSAHCGICGVRGIACDHPDGEIVVDCEPHVLPEDVEYPILCVAPEGCLLCEDCFQKGEL